jgi:hypothetical protein
MKLKAKDRTTINAKLADLCRNRLPALPLDTIAGYLHPLGIKMEEAIYCGHEGRCNIDLFWNERYHLFFQGENTSDLAFEDVTNSVLVLYWLKGENTDTYEVNAYLS